MLPRIARFCAECGADLAASPAGPGVRLPGARGREQAALVTLVLLYGGTLAAILVLATIELSPLPELMVWIAIEGSLTASTFGLLIRAGMPFGARWSATAAHSGWAVGIGLATAAFSLAFVHAVLAVVGETADTPPLDAIWIVAAVVVAPLLEESMCRGVLWQALAPFTAARARIASAAVLFGLLHCLQGLVGFTHRFVGGLAFGWLRERSSSLLPPILAHATHNAAVLAWVYW